MTPADKAKAGHVEHDGSFWIWAPQVGGYSSPALVHSFQHGEGCFDVDVYHDGEFPQDDCQASFHCCSAEQFVKFGQAVAEKLRPHLKEPGH